LFGAAIERQKTAREAAKSDARLAKLERLNEAIGQHPDGETKTALRGFARLKSEEFDELIEDLIERKSVEVCRFKKGSKAYPGFRRRPFESSRNKPEFRVGPTARMRLRSLRHRLFRWQAFRFYGRDRNCPHVFATRLRKAFQPAEDADRSSFRASLFHRQHRPGP
jgi:hypothetical protein